MKKIIAIALALILALITFTACGNTETVEPTTETSTISEIETTETLEPVSIEMKDIINDISGGKPIVKVYGDEGKTLLSFDFSETSTKDIEVTLDESVKEDYLYITMSGNVTDHSLESDGSMFDGIVDIINGKAEFTVEYNNEKVISFTIKVPKN